MGTISTFLNLALGQEDSFGKVLAGSTGKGGKTLWKEAGADGAKGAKKFSNFVKNANTEVLKFDKAMNLASDVFDKGTMKAIKKNGKTGKAFSQNIIELFGEDAGKKLTKEQISGFLTKNNITEVKESKGLFKSMWGSIKGTKANVINADTIASKAASKLSEAAVKNGDDIAKGALKSSKGLKSLWKSLKGKGGTLGIALTVAFELPDIVKAFKNGDGVKQVGRSVLSVGGFAGGAAIGAAIGSVIPVAGTAVGGLIGGLCGIVGGMICGSATNKLGNAVFGKSIEDKKTEQAEKQQESLKQAQLAQAQNPNMFNLNTMG